MVGFDASIALAIWMPDVPCSVDRGKERIEYLLEELESRRERILIPAPALSEVLVRAGEAGAELVNQISRSSRFEIAAFDDLAAIETALSISAVKRSGNKRGKDISATWAKVKFDHQIVAICKVHQVKLIYSDDPGLRDFAESIGLRAVSLADLPLRPQEPTLFDGLELTELMDSRQSSETLKRLPAPRPGDTSEASPKSST